MKIHISKSWTDMISVHCVSWLALFLALIGELRGGTSIAAFEPFKVDSTQEAMAEQSHDIDHLIPEYHNTRELDCLVEYWAHLRGDKSRFVVLVKDRNADHYYLEQGDPPKTNLYGRPYHYTKRREVSQETANVMYELWVNMLLESRHDRKSYPMSLGGDLFTFSTFVRGLGYMHGYAVTNGDKDVPPRWLVDVGEDIFAFVTKGQLDESVLRDKVTSCRDRFYQYMKQHPCP